MLDLDPIKARWVELEVRWNDVPALIAEVERLRTVAGAAERFHELNYRFRNPFPIHGDAVTADQYDEASQELVDALRTVGMPQPPDLEGVR